MMSPLRGFDYQNEYPRYKDFAPDGAANPAGASWWPSLRPVRRVAELGSLGHSTP